MGAQYVHLLKQYQQQQQVLLKNKPPPAAPATQQADATLTQCMVAAVAPGMESLVQLGFPPSRALDALDVASGTVEDDNGFIEGELRTATDTSLDGESGGDGGGDGPR